MLKCEMNCKSGNVFVQVDGSIEDIILEISAIIKTVYSKIPDDMLAMAFRDGIKSMLTDDSPVWERDDVEGGAEL